MTNLVQTKYSIDPTEGLVDYVLTVKPYHTKILEVLVEYVYTDDVKVTIQDNWTWDMYFSNTTTAASFTGTINGNVLTVLTIGSGVIEVGQTLFLVGIINGVTIEDQLTGTLGGIGTYTISAPFTITTSQRLTTMAPRDTVRACGWGWGWDLIPVTNSVLTSRILSAHPSPEDNYFLIEPSTSSNLTMDLITGINPGLNGSFIISGDGTSNYFVGQTLIVMGNSISGNNTSYPITSVVYNGSTTTITINGFLTPLSLPRGTIPYASLKTYSWIVTNTQAGQISLVTPYTVSAVNAALKKWTVSSHISPLPSSGDTIYITNNTVVFGQDSNGKYTVVSATIVGLTTEVVVNEYITPLAVSDGTLNIPLAPENCPSWPIGVKLALTAAGALPTPLSTGTPYYFVPDDLIGTFNLATTKYPAQYSDYIHTTDIGSGSFSISRDELFTVGSYVNVNGSALAPNNKTYGVINVVPAGNNFRVYVRDKIPELVQPGTQFDGIMTQQSYPGYDPIDGFDSLYCPPAHSSNLFTDTVIKETLLIEVIVSLNEYINPTISEIPTSGFGVEPFSAGVWGEYGGTTDGLLLSSTAITTSNLMIPPGYDTQFFDIGGMSE